MVAELDALLARAHGVLPEHLAAIDVSLCGAASRETHKLWMKVRHCLNKVLAERAILAIHPEL